MSRKATISVIAAIALIVLIFLALFFELRDVADYEWHLGDYELEEPYGKKVFKDLIYQRFDSVHVMSNSDTISTDSFQSPGLFICLGREININGKMEKRLMEYISQGNDALLIANTITFNFYSHEFPIYTYNSIADSIISIAYNNEGDIADTFSFKYYYDDFNEAQLYYFNIAEHDSDEDDHLMTAYKCDSSTTALTDYKPRIMGYESFGSGCIYYHTVPEVFYNHMALQEDYLPHFNRVFDRFSATSAILSEEPKWRDTEDQAYAENQPLDYIFDTPSLKWAYYTLMGALFLYIIFKGKRKQKVVPILPKNENTSLEFVHTLSNLFLDQNQHEKLVMHMKDIFYNWVKGRYYLDHNDALYAEKLSKKSKIPRQDIDVILNRFQNVQEHFSFNDDQLYRLSKRLDAFYKNAI